ncbi:MAG: GAF domain-containing protein [Candidatus Omnitrophota bacterium]
MQEKDQQLLLDIFSKDHWLIPLERFIQVLRINIFVLDNAGRPIIHPCGTSRGEEFGCRVLTNFFGVGGLGQGESFLRQFTAYGDYLEFRSPLDLHVFSIPLRAYGRIVAYLIVGPVITNKRLADEEYLSMADQAKLPSEGLLDEISGIRVVSYVAMNAILDLLAAVTKDFIEIGLENRRLKKAKLQREILPKEITQVAEGLHREIKVDELLVSVLDVALRLTGAESGSIMIFDKGSKEMAVRVSRGLDEERAKSAKVKMGEGIAGTAARENRCFVIHGQKGDSRIQSYLKRPEIRESIVMPIAHHNRVLGVMNLHSKKEDSHIEDNSGYLMGLSKLLSTAIFSN